MERFTRSPLLLFVMLALVVLEWLWRRGVPRLGYDGREAGRSIVIALGHIVVGALTAGVLGGMFARLNRLAPMRWPMHDIRTWAAAFVLVEFCYYWSHRTSHTVRWMWATHAVHHTPEQITLLSAIRLGWTNLLSFGWVFYVPLALAGFDSRVIFTLLAVNLHYQFFLHTEAVGKLGPLEWLLNTPAHHRVHHASNDAYLDCNYGGVLIVFDRMFGTLRAERKDEPLRYGLAHPLDTRHPIAMALAEWRRLMVDMYRAPSLRGAVKLALGRP